MFNNLVSKLAQWYASWIAKQVVRNLERPQGVRSMLFVIRNGNEEQKTKAIEILESWIKEGHGWLIAEILMSFGKESKIFIDAQQRIQTLDSNVSLDIWMKLWEFGGKALLSTRNILEKRVQEAATDNQFLLLKFVKTGRSWGVA